MLVATVQTITADRLQSTGWNVLQDACDEFDWMQANRPLLSRLAVLVGGLTVAKDHLVLTGAEDSMIADRALSDGQSHAAGPAGATHSRQTGAEVLEWFLASTAGHNWKRREIAVTTKEFSKKQDKTEHYARQWFASMANYHCINNRDGWQFDEADVRK